MNMLRRNYDNSGNVFCPPDRYVRRRIGTILAGIKIKAA